MITKVDAKAGVFREGLGAVELSRLGRVVVLAGPNGSGKTRLLNEVRRLYANRSGTKDRIHEQRRRLASGGRDAPTESERTAMVEHVERGEDELRAITCFPDPARLPPVDLSVLQASSLKILDALAFAPRDLANHSQQLRSHLGLTHTLGYAHVAIQEVALALYHAGHVEHQKDADDVAELERAQLFNALLKSLLGTEVGYKVVQRHPVATLFGAPFEAARLSAGQRVLLSWAVTLHLRSKDIQLTDVVLFIDEPENHLHPSAAVDALDRLVQALSPSGQIWLATHSPAVVAHFGAESIYHVENGSATFAGSKLDQLMDALLGGAAGRNAFLSFMSDAHEAGFVRMAAQCLMDATISDAASDDQSKQVAANIAKRAKEAAPVRVLDYAAGKGRFARALSEMFVAPRPFLYFAYNHPAHNGTAADCTENIAMLNQPGDPAAYLSTELSDFHAEGQVDMIVMCNYLHEAEPRNWASDFATCAVLLKEGGRLFILEDQEISVGELPHADGFLILDLHEVRVLFGAGPMIESLSQDPRLSVIAVPKPLLSAVTHDSTRRALEHLRERALGQLRAVRLASEERKGDARLGRKHAFFSLLHANASLALGEA